MPLVVKDRVRETSVTAGTGTITLAGAVNGFQSFSVIGNGNTTYYTIVDPLTNAWEVGIGTYTSSGTTLSRDTILESSSGGAAVNFSSNSKDVFVTYPAERSVYVDGSTITPATSASLPVANGGTGQTSYTDGQLLIGNTATTGLTKATLTAGSNVTITNGNGTITVASTNPGGDVVGPASATDNAIVRFDNTTGKLVQDSGVVIDDSGNVGIGTTTPSVMLDITNTVGGTAGMTAQGNVAVNNVLYRASDDTGAPNINYRKSRGTLAAPTAIATGDFLGTINFQGYGGTTVRSLGALRCAVENYTSDTNISSYLSLNTTNSGTAFSERMRITAAGNVGIGITAPSVSLDVLGTIEAQAALTQDAIAIAGRAGGTSSYVATITPTTLTASRTITLPDASTTVVGTDATQTLTNKTLDAGTVVTANSSATALRITQTGAGNALVVEDETNPDSSPFVVDASGLVGIGTTTPAAALDVVNSTGGNSQLFVRGQSAVNIVAQRSSSDAIGVGFGVRKTRGTIASPTAVATNDVVGNYFYQGYGGTNDRNIANIQGLIENYTSDTNISGAIIFQTTNAGTSPADRLRISANGTLTSQATYDNTAAGSNVVVTSAGLIRRTSSSIKYKKDVEDLNPVLVTNAVENLRPVWYRTKNSEGDDRPSWSHVGLIAEEAALVEPRLVRFRTVSVTEDEEGRRVETPLDTPEPEDVDYGRLAVLLLAEIKTQRKTIEELTKRIESLENNRN